MRKMDVSAGQYTDSNSIPDEVQNNSSRWTTALEEAMDALLAEAIRLALTAKSETVRYQMIKELMNHHLIKEKLKEKEPQNEGAGILTGDDLRRLSDDELHELWRKVHDLCCRRNEKK